jgi:hypothetical protein
MEIKEDLTHTNGSQLGLGSYSSSSLRDACRERCSSSKIQAHMFVLASYPRLLTRVRAINAAR